MKCLVQLAITVCMLVPFCVSAEKIDQRLAGFCNNQIDTVGCLLNLAKTRARKIDSLNIQAEAFARLLSTLAALKRTDYDSFERASLLIRNPKLGVEQRLDLHVAIASYLFPYSEEIARSNLRAANDLFSSEVKNANWRKRLMLTVWACGLMDQSQDVWTSSVRTTTRHCKPPSEYKTDDDILQSIAINMAGMFTSWVQSSYEEANAYKDAFYQNIRELEGQAVSRKSKTLMQTALEMSVHADIILAYFHNIAGSKTTRDRYVASALKNLNELQSKGAALDALKLKLEVANYFANTYDFKRSEMYLLEIAGSFSGKNAKTIPKEEQAAYFTYLAYAVGQGGFKDENELKTADLQMRQRQADVLYERYQIQLEKEENRNSLSDVAVDALETAASAGHTGALHDLALLFSEGNGRIQKDLGKAHDLFFRSALTGFAGAQNNLGDLYENLDNDNKLLGLAIYWYTQAAMQAEPTAYFSLGSLFVEGKGVPKNQVLGAMWLWLAVTHLPDGKNKADASKLLEKTLSTLDDKAKEFARAAALSFIPLRETKDKLEDRPN